MSHLLTRLADRALGIAPTIEPVRAPMFGGEPAGYGETAEHETTGFAYGDIVTGPHADQPATRETSDAFSSTTASQLEQGSTPDSSVQPVASRVLHEPSAVEEDIPFKRSANGQQQSREPVDSSALAARPPSLTETNAVDPEPPATALSPVTSQASRSIDSQSPADEQGAKEADIFSERSASSDPLAQAPAESLLRPRDLKLASFSTQSAIDTFPQERNNAQTRQPTIKVTIGRIEVRAVTTPPVQQPRQRKKPQPSLSLDDYLKQRAGGQR
jgi:hypothetical protein